MLVASLFSGAGGLDWGFKTAGYKIVYAADINRSAVATYSRNFGLKPAGCVVELGTAAACDVRRLDFSRLRGEVDVLIGGPPCQDFSVVRGPRAPGAKTPRGSLIFEFARALEEIQPTFFVFENVPGLKSMTHDYYTLLAAVLRAGYAVAFSDVVDFARFGAPQRRERLIIVGVKNGASSAAELGVAIRRALSGSLLARYPLTPLEVFEGRRLDQLTERYREVMEAWRGVWSEVNTEKARRWKKEVWDKLTFDVVEDYLLLNDTAQKGAELEEALKTHEAVLKELGYLGRRVCEKPLPDGTCELPSEDAATLKKLRLIPPGENHEFLEGTRWGASVKINMRLLYWRLHPLKPAPTVVAHGGGGTHGYHYERSRGALTLRERARLQTFPDSFYFYGNATEKRAQIGEAVPPLAAKRIAEILKKHYA